MTERAPASPRPRKGLPRHTKILFGLLFGIVVGLTVHAVGGDAPWVDWSVKNVAYPLGQLFLRLIFMIVVPLVFSSLVLGVLELGDMQKLGRVGLKTLAYTLFASGISVGIGIGLVNYFKPGVGVDPSVRAQLGGAFAAQSQKTIEDAQKALPWTDTLLSLIPRNPLVAAVNALQGEMLALMVFAVFFGVALAQIRRDKETLIDVFDGIQRTSMKIVDWAMGLAPFGVAALMYSLTAKSGFAVVPRLGGYVGVVVAGLAIQQFVVYSAILKVLARVPPVEWFFRVREVVLTASIATLSAFDSYRRPCSSPLVQPDQSVSQTDLSFSKQRDYSRRIVVRRRKKVLSDLSKAHIRLSVNGESVEAAFAPHKTLLEVLREDLGLTGTKHGCELGECGTCAVLVDGKPVLSCLVLGLECEDRRVETVEGMAGPGGLHPLQKAFSDLGAAQCGYCTPGFLLTARALLEENPKPTLPQIKEALAGNLCRCTGYIKIFEAVDLAAAWMRGEEAQPRHESLYGFDFDESGLLPVVDAGGREGRPYAHSGSKVVGAGLAPARDREKGS